MNNRNQQSTVKIVWDMNFEIVLDRFTYKTGLILKKYFWEPNYDIETEKMTDFSMPMSSKNSSSE